LVLDLDSLHAANDARPPDAREACRRDFFAVPRRGAPAVQPPGRSTNGYETVTIPLAGAGNCRRATLATMQLTTSLDPSVLPPSSAFVTAPRSSMTKRTTTRPASAGFVARLSS